MPRMCGRPAGILEGEKAYCAGHALLARAPSRQIRPHLIIDSKTVYAAVQLAVYMCLPDVPAREVEALVSFLFERIQKDATLVLLEEGDRLWKASDVMKVVSQRKSLTVSDVVRIINDQTAQDEHAAQEDEDNRKSGK